MNRDIKFRGKDLETGKWVYGDLLQYNEGGVAIGIHGQFIDDGYHFNEYWNRCPLVDEDTVGQFTGITGGDGKEIYEGDILKVKDGNGYLEVFWSDDKSAFLVEDYNEFGETSGMLWYLSEHDISRYVVCGNIYDNTDILKK